MSGSGLVSSVMLVGLGELGGLLLQLLAGEPGIGPIYAASRDLGRGEARCNLARLSAAARGLEKEIQFHPLDLREEESVAELVNALSPDILLTTATPMSWWLPGFLPSGAAEKLDSLPFGIWLPAYLSLTIRLMNALKVADFRGLSLVAPFPDVVCPVLHRLGLTPTCGIGNLAEILPKVQQHAARCLDAPLEAVQVYLVGHHALEAYVFGGIKDRVPSVERPPYFMRVEYQGQEVSVETEAHTALFTDYHLPPGYETHFLTGAVTMRHLRALRSRRGRLVHTPGPNGLPGGYPVLANRQGVRVSPPQGISLEEAIAINEASHRFDGIETIEEDGTVIFSEELIDSGRAILGYDCPRLPPGDIEGRAEELLQRLKSFKEGL